MVMALRKGFLRLCGSLEEEEFSPRSTAVRWTAWSFTEEEEDYRIKIPWYSVEKKFLYYLVQTPFISE